MSGIYYFANAIQDPIVKEELMKKSNMTTKEYSATFNPTGPDTIRGNLAAINETLSKTYWCRSSTGCTTDELALAQYANSSLTDFYQ